MTFGGVMLWCGGPVQARPPIVPQAMLEACASLQAGDPCRFELSGKAIEGLCAPLPDEALACRPGGKGKPSKAKPPALKP